jgi:RNA polymerase sigma factor (sigma-70 family)
MNTLEIYLNNKSKLLNFAASRLTQKSDADDIVQKVFIYLNNKKIEDFTDENHVVSWMIWVTKNECAVNFRRNHKYIPFEEGELERKVDEFSDPYRDTEEKDFKALFMEKLPAAMGRLSPLQRKAIDLYFLQGKNRQEISKITKSKPDTVSVAINKAVKTLKDYFKKTFKEFYTEACWKGYQQVGMKKKRGKKVPNCVPK